MYNLHRNKIGLAFFCFLFCMNLPGFCQENLQNYDRKWIHFGFSLGLNGSSFRTFHNQNFANNDTLLAINPFGGPGLLLGIVSDLKITDKFHLRFQPSLMFAQKNISYEFSTQSKPVVKKVESAYVDFPLLLRFRGQKHDNRRIYWLAGAKYSIDMSNQSKVKEEDLTNIKINRYDFGIEYGVGFEFYLPYFKFSPEIKVAQSLRNVLVQENHVFASSLDRLVPRAIIITFHFE